MLPNALGSFVRSIVICNICIFTVFSLPTYADESSPAQDQLNLIIDKITWLHEHNKAFYKAMPDKLVLAHQRYIEPHIDYDQMAKQSLPNDTWSKLNKKQQKTFVNTLKIRISDQIASLYDADIHYQISIKPLDKNKQVASFEVNLKDTSSQVEYPILIKMAYKTSADRWFINQIHHKNQNWMQSFQNINTENNHLFGKSTMLYQWQDVSGLEIVHKGWLSPNTLIAFE